MDNLIPNIIAIFRCTNISGAPSSSPVYVGNGGNVTWVMSHVGLHLSSLWDELHIKYSPFTMSNSALAAVLDCLHFLLPKELWTLALENLDHICTFCVDSVCTSEKPKQQWQKTLKPKISNSDFFPLILYLIPLNIECILLSEYLRFLFYFYFQSKETDIVAIEKNV